MVWSWCTHSCWHMEHMHDVIGTIALLNCANQNTSLNVMVITRCWYVPLWSLPLCVCVCVLCVCLSVSLSVRVCTHTCTHVIVSIFNRWRCFSNSKLSRRELSDKRLLVQSKNTGVWTYACVCGTCVQHFVWACMCACACGICCAMLWCVFL